MERIFFDNNATTKLSEASLNAILNCYKAPLNSSSIHYFGREANKIYNKTKSEIANLLNAKNYQIIFTSGGTEANNLGIFGLPNYQIITSQLEHSSVYDPAIKRKAIITKVNSDGIIDIEDLKEKINAIDTPNFLVSLMLANNETGAIQPIKEIAKLVHAKNGLIHSDLIQAIGKIEIDLEDLNIDIASISAHKFGGPGGIGALLIRVGIDLEPMILGGGQEGGKRSGTVNIAGIAGLGSACENANERIRKNQNLAELRNYLEISLKTIGGDDVIIFSQNAERLPNTSLIATKGTSNQIQLIDFDLNGIAISIGSACSSGSAKPSRILQAMNIDADLIKSTIRIILGIDNNKTEIDKFIEIWSKLYKRTRN